MTASPLVDFPMEPQPEREDNEWKRPIVWLPDHSRKKTYTRCTTYVGCLDDTYQLDKWGKRMVAAGLSQRRDLVLQMQSLAPSIIGRLSADVSPEAKRQADELCEKALDAAQAGAAATSGTALHLIMERLDRGLDIGSVDQQTRADVDAYAAATQCLTALHIERFLVNDDLRVGGTPDRVVRYQGRNYIGDIKTGSVEWASLKIACQLAMYAHSDLYDVQTGARSPLPDVDLDRAIVIHLPAGSGTCTLRWVDIRKGWEAVQVATMVRDWRRRGRRLISDFDGGATLGLSWADPQPTLPPAAAPIPAEHARLPDTQPPLQPWGPPVEQPMPTPSTPARRSLEEQIAAAASVDELTTLWRNYRVVWTAQHSELAVARKVLLTAGAA